MFNIQTIKRGRRVKLLEGLIEFWPLNEASGTRRGAANQLTLTDNNTVTGNPGACDSLASQFTAANSEYLSRASSSALQTGDIDFSFVVWVYMDSKPGASLSFLSKGGGDSTREFLFQWVQASDLFRFLLYDGVSTPVGSVVDTNFGSPSLATWYMICASHNSTSNAVSISVNAGEPVTSATTGTPAITTGELRIGANNSTSPQYFNGRIQRVGFWKRLLTQEEIVFLYKNGCGSEWRFYSN